MNEIVFNKSLLVAGAFGALVMGVNSTALGMFSEDYNLSVPEFTPETEEEIEAKNEEIKAKYRESFDRIKQEYKKFKKLGLTSETLKFICDKLGKLGYVPEQKNATLVSFLFYLGYSKSVISRYSSESLFKQLEEEKSEVAYWTFAELEKEPRIGDTTPYKIDFSGLPEELKRDGVREHFIEFVAKIIEKYKDSVSCLVLRDCSINSRDVVLFSESLKTLSSLNISNNRIDDEGVKVLCEGLGEELHTLNISHNEISDRGLEAIAQCKNLVELDISDNKIDDEGAEILCKGLGEEFHTLNISRNKIGDRGLEAISQRKNLVKLDISYNKIDDEGVKSIRGFEKLEYLDISHNEIGNPGAEVVVELLQAKKWCPELYCLGMSNERIDDSMYERFIEAMRKREQYFRSGMVFGWKDAFVRVMKP